MYTIVQNCKMHGPVARALKTWFGSSKQRKLKVPSDVGAGAFLLRIANKNAIYKGV